MKRFLSLILSLAIIVSLVPCALAATDEATQAAQTLYDLGLFKGTGTNEDGTPIFNLDRTPTRNQALIMLVRLLGKESEATAQTWDIPFTDVSGSMTSYVGYAYNNSLTTGKTETSFGGSAAIRANQYITFVLRALGYESGTDFRVSTACDFSDEIGLTSGEYTASSAFTRGDVAIISLNALFMTLKDGSMTLADSLGLSVEKPKPTASKLLHGYWAGANKTDSASYMEVYHFDGTQYACVCMVEDSSDTALFLLYEEGTFTVSGSALTLNRTAQYTLFSGSSETELDKNASSNAYEVYVFSEEALAMNSWIYQRQESAESFFSYGKEAVLGKYTEPVDYSYLAASDFRSVRRDYPSAVATAGYAYEYTNLNGEHCVLTVVSYRIISDFSVVTLHNLTTGKTIEDPESYYDTLANRAYGATKINYMKLKTEALEHLVTARQAMVSVLQNGENTAGGNFASAEYLNQ